MLRVSNKCPPRRPHLVLQLVLRIRLGNASDFSGLAKDHVKLYTMIRSTRGVEAGVVPVRVVLKSPDGCMSATSVCGFEVGWTEESLHIEVVPLLVCQYRALGVG